jgi:hypothetical protein
VAPASLSHRRLAAVTTRRHARADAADVPQGALLGVAGGVTTNAMVRAADGAAGLLSVVMLGFACTHDTACAVPHMRLTVRSNDQVCKLRRRTVGRFATSPVGQRTRRS